MDATEVGTTPLLTDIAGPERSTVDVVAFPCAGGGPSMFARWGGRLPSAWRLRGVCLPGRETRLSTAYATDMTALGEEVAAALDATACSPRVVFLGHSMGSVLAREVARHREPDLMVTVATASPGTGWIARHHEHDQRLLDESAERRARRTAGARRDWTPSLVREPDRPRGRAAGRRPGPAGDVPAPGAATEVRHRLLLRARRPPGGGRTGLGDHRAHLGHLGRGRPLRGPRPTRGA
ncbi:thioesterase domain-containing protein [Nocardioides convexus]|uniref:thioesterase II family protein n=1 Tax=Nocardioides convexus TaxID=2712224 RepID=UPI0024184EE7|nr:thioesterase domain-containing protein [Nocardioides convexus]